MNIMKQIIFALLLLISCKVYCQDITPMQISDSVYIWLTTGKYDQIEKHWNQSWLTESKITDLAEQYAGIWEQLIKQYGKFQYITDYAELDSSSNGVTIIRNFVFENDSIGVKVSVNKNNEIVGQFFVPAIVLNYKDADYVDTSKFEEFDIAFAEFNNITGKITIPKNINKKVPCVVLVHGSGPNDFDESAYGRKPFRDIAYGLSSNGIAVLRYNKRTYLNKIENINNFTMDDETINDAVSAVDFVKNNYTDKIDKIYVLGHSQGGYAMPRIAKKSKTAAGFISIAGNSRPMPELIKEQYNYFNDLFGMDEDILNKIIKDSDFILSGNFTKDTPTDSLLFNTPAPYWLDLKNYNPVKEFQKEKRPILFIQGGRDYQVPMKDFKLWQDGLSKNKNCKFVLIEELNHILQEGEGRSVPSEYQEPINVSKKIIDNILVWINIK
jgi:fermentation-respiration switch protein FrsA (DUF1100 family)